MSCTGRKVAQITDVIIADPEIDKEMNRTFQADKMRKVETLAYRACEAKKDPGFVCLTHQAMSIRDDLDGLTSDSEEIQLNEFG